MLIRSFIFIFASNTSLKGEGEGEQHCYHHLYSSFVSFVVCVISNTLQTHQFERSIKHHIKHLGVGLHSVSNSTFNLSTKSVRSFHLINDEFVCCRFSLIEYSTRSRQSLNWSIICSLFNQSLFHISILNLFSLPSSTWPPLLSHHFITKKKK